MLSAFHFGWTVVPGASSARDIKEKVLSRIHLFPLSGLFVEKKDNIATTTTSVNGRLCQLIRVL